MAETGLSAAYEAAGIANRALDKEERRQETWSAGLEDTGGALITLGGYQEEKAADDLAFESGKKLLLAEEGSEYIDDISPASSIWDIKSYGKQPGVKYNEKYYNREQIITLGESSVGEGLYKDDNAQKLVLGNWEKLMKGKDDLPSKRGSWLISSIGDAVSNAYTGVVKEVGSWGQRDGKYSNPIPRREEFYANYIEPKYFDDNPPQIGGPVPDATINADYIKYYENKGWKYKDNIWTDKSDPIAQIIDNDKSDPFSTE